MKIQIYCNKCNKLEVVNKSVEEKSNNSHQNGLIPIPRANNGLTTYSLVHQDHTLIVDIDAEGNVRGERTIQRIDQQIENILAAIAQRILSYIENYDKEPVSIVVITENERMRKMILGIFQQLIFNMGENLHGLLSITKGESLFELGPLNVWVGNAKVLNFGRIYSLLSESTTFVYQIETHSVVEIAEIVNQNLKHRSDANYVVLCEPEFMKSNLGKEYIKELIIEIPGLQILDVDNPEKIAMALYSIIDNVISEKVLVLSRKS